MSRRRPMSAAVAERFNADLATARAAVRGDEIDRAWAMLEEAHVLAQPWVWPHVKVHVLMLRLGWRTKDRREVTGQLARIIVAGLGSLSGRYPVGNTGRASVPATQPMPMADELRELLADESVRPATVRAFDG
jgi:hypothetical protein